MDEKKMARIAKAFGIEPDEVTEEHEKAYDEMIAEAVADQPKPKPKMAGPKHGEEDDTSKGDPEIAKRLEALSAELAEQKETTLALERKLAERPDPAAHVRPQFELNVKALIDPAMKTTGGEEMRANLRDWQEFNDDCVFMSAILGGRGDRVNMRDTKFYKRWVKSRGDWGKFVDEYKGFWENTGRELGDVVPDQRKATFTTTTGSDYIPTILSSNLIETMRYELNAANAVLQFDMTSKVHDIPGEGADVTVYKTAETATVTQADTDDRKVTLTAKDIKARSKYTDDIDEDSIIPVLPLHKRKHAVGMAEGIEFAVIHGDTDDTQGQSSNSNITQYTMYDAWNGLHAAAIAASTAEIAVGGTLWDGQNAMNQIRALGAYYKPARCAWLMHPIVHAGTQMMYDYQATGYRNIILLRGGAQAPITGLPLDMLMGSPILPSGQVSIHNASTGYYDGASTDRTQVYLFNRDAFVLGDRRAITVETDKTISTGVIEIVTTWRGDFAWLYASGQNSISAAINIDYDAAPG